MKIVHDLNSGLLLTPYRRIQKMPRERWSTRKLRNAIGWISLALVGCVCICGGIVAGTVKIIVDKKHEHEMFVKQIDQLMADISRLHDVNFYSTKQTLEIASQIQKVVGSSSGVKREFLSEMVPEALRLQITHSIPASATIAMAVYESDYGRSDLAQKYHNYFGIKALSHDWTGEVANMPTRDRGVRRIQPFRVYSDLRTGVMGYGDFLSKTGRYHNAFQHSKGRDFVVAVLKAGYCPDQNYLSSIEAIIDRHKLFGLDVPAEIKAGSEQAVATLLPTASEH